jgi:hypothetical protein
VPAALSAHRDSAPFVLIVMVITGCDDSSSVTSSSSSPTSVPTMAARSPPASSCNRSWKNSKLLRQNWATGTDRGVHVAALRTFRPAKQCGCQQPIDALLDGLVINNNPRRPVLVRHPKLLPGVGGLQLHRSPGSFICERLMA